MTVKKLEINVPKIAPVPEGIDRPFWSVMIPNYNCADYLAETLKSVLQQDPGPEEMHIEVVDDCSTKDDPETVVREIGKGRVAFFRQPQNRGPSANFNTCIQRSRGQWVHILHSDDTVIPGFYSHLQAGVQQEPTIGAAFCRHIYTDGEGQWHSLSTLERHTPGIILDWLERIVVSQRIETPAIVVKRSVYEKLGGYYSQFIHAADWEMWRRIAVHYPVWYEPKPLACYRVQSGSDSSQLMRTGANIADIRKSIEIAQSYLPVEIAVKASSQAKLNYALTGIGLARRMLDRNDIEAAIALAWEGLKCCHSSQVIDSLLALLNSIEPEPLLTGLYSRGEQHKEDIIIQSALVSLRQALQIQAVSAEKLLPRIVIDGVIFQFQKTEIAQIWKTLLETWAKNGFAKHIVLLDRGGTAPKIPDIAYISIPQYTLNNISANRALLQQICEEQGAELFVSTYYTTAISTPSVFMAYNSPAQLMQWEPLHPLLHEKYQTIRQASSYVSLFKNIASELVRFFPNISPNSITLAHYGVSSHFSIANDQEIERFKTKYGITKPYFILVGLENSFKNAALFFKALSKLHNYPGIELVCIGSEHLLETELRSDIPGIVVHTLQLDDEELSLAYSGAVALVYLLKNEGIGLPLLEAMACGCPVITDINPSFLEVTGKAAIYVNDEDVNELTNALCDVQKSHVRNSMIVAGIEQVKQLSWSNMAKNVSSALINTTLLPLKLKEINLIIFIEWSQPEDTIGFDLERVIYAIATHPDCPHMTLLIDTSGFSTNEAELLLSSVTMNLLMQGLDITEEQEISLIGDLAKIQWEALLPRIQGRIRLENENEEAIARVGAQTIPLCDLNSFQATFKHCRSTQPR